MSKNSDSTCVSFPGPGDRHIYDFNPMHEFIYRKEGQNEDHVDNEFDKFKKNHAKSYNDNTEHESRKNLFRQNMRFLYSNNNGVIIL